MQTLYIDRKNLELSVENKRLLIKSDRRLRTSLPLNQIDSIVISAGISFSSGLLTRLTQQGVSLVFLNPRNSDACTVTHGIMHNHVQRRLWQYQAFSDAKLRLSISQLIVVSKLRGQRNLLKKALPKRPQKRFVLIKAIEQLEKAIEAAESSLSVDSLRGIEGAAAASFFNAYTEIFAPSLLFEGRNRRPPKDPVNAVLSLTYSLLHAEAVRALFSVGFDPLLGIYHDLNYGRESLACDLVELFRPHAELWVWRMFAEEVLRADHFSSYNETKDQACLLQKAGREIYFRLYNEKAKRWRRLMRNNLRLMLKQLPDDLT